jgi:hypothetical protein
MGTSSKVQVAAAAMSTTENPAFEGAQEAGVRDSAEPVTRREKFAVWVDYIGERWPGLNFMYVRNI